jgi:small-conductance mechanosensitive channel
MTTPAAARIDQLPAWAFVTLGVAALATTRAGRLFSLLHRNQGGMELFGILTMAVFLLIVIFAVRRRQEAAWRSAMHVMGALVAGNALGIVLIWPFVPGSYGLALGPLLHETMVSGLTLTLLVLPLCVLLLWLSRKYGSHSALTERRMRVIREVLRRRTARNQGRGAAS